MNITKSIVASVVAVSLALICSVCSDNGAGIGDGPASDFLIKYNIELDMEFVSGGTFRMGCTRVGDCWGDEFPVHSVTLSDFYIGRYEITRRQWWVVMGGENPSHSGMDGNLPMERVSWNDVSEFIARLNAATGMRYRLPTEAEWEFAARGGIHSEGFRFAGSDVLDSVAWYGDSYFGDTKGNSGNMTHPVGTKFPNELGLYDMSGNVWEFVSDWWGPYTGEEKIDPQGPETGYGRVVRGGSAHDDPSESRVSARYYCDPERQYFGVGFRLVR